MTKTFEIPLNADAEAVVAQAKITAERQGAEFAGDRFAGRFSGNGVEGSYEISGDVAIVTIDSKPDVAPWPLVEQAIRGFFDGAAAAGPPKSGPKPKSKQAEALTRRLRAGAVIKKHVLWSTGAGLIPIPLADLAAVTAVQVSMLEDLSEIYEVTYSEPVIKNFVTALTGGMLARIGASMVKAIPGLGSLIGGLSMSVMSGASTYAVGQVARNELESSGDLSKVDISRAKSEFKAAFEKGKEFVADLEKSEAANGDSGGDSDETIAKLERLGKLRDDGVLTEKEFQAQKNKLLL